MKKFTLTALSLAFAAVAASLQAQNDPAPPPPPPVSAPAEPVMVDGLVVVEKLPTSAQLLSDAEAENLTITRMQQASDRMVVTYQYPSGRTRTFAYTTTLPMDPETEVAVIPPMPAPAPTYRVIYSEPAPVYRSYPRYAPRYYDDPFGPSLSIGLGFGRSYGGYGYGYSGGHDYYRYSGHHGHHRENHHRGHHGDTHHRGRHR